jgi:hypothetical protein
VLFPPFKRIRLLGIWLLLAALAFLYGCERNGDSQGPRPWPETAVVAELPHLPSFEAAEATLTDLKAMGFDTVLLEARGAPRPLLQHWLDPAESMRLRTVAWMDSPKPAGAAPSGERRVAPDGHAPLADGLILTVEHPGDLASAQELHEILRESGSDTLLIARIAAHGSGNGPEPAIRLPVGLFGAILEEQASRDTLSLLDPEDPMPPSAFAEKYQPGDAAQGEQENLPRWQRIPHCQRSADQRCSEDMRLLVMGFIQDAAPVTGFIDEPFWRDVYASLIPLRRETPLIREGDMDWYAADDTAGVLAYRITNDRRDHVLVAVNVSHDHHELPLPFGFMAVSKIKLWASYDPRVRELVTSRPVALPAGSVVVVVKE